MKTMYAHAAAKLIILFLSIPLAKPCYVIDFFDTFCNEPEPETEPPTNSPFPSQTPSSFPSFISVAPTVSFMPTTASPSITPKIDCDSFDTCKNVTMLQSSEFIVTAVNRPFGPRERLAGANRLNRTVFEGKDFSRECNSLNEVTTFYELRTPLGADVTVTFSEPLTNPVMFFAMPLSAIPTAELAFKSGTLVCAQGGFANQLGGSRIGFSLLSTSFIQVDNKLRPAAAIVIQGFRITSVGFVTTGPLSFVSFAIQED